MLKEIHKILPNKIFSLVYSLPEMVLGVLAEKFPTRKQKATDINPMFNNKKGVILFPLKLTKQTYNNIKTVLSSRFTLSRF